MQGKIASEITRITNGLNAIGEHLIKMEIGRYRFPKRLLAVIAVNYQKKNTE